MINFAYFLFILWTLSFCGFWLKFSLLQSSLYATLTTLFLVFNALAPQKKEAPKKPHDGIKELAKNTNFNVTVYKKVNGKWVTDD